MASDPLAILITCEHAGNRVPEEYAHLFDSAEARLLLHSHRGWDPGAIVVALHLAQRLCAPILSWPVTRLLVESNRTILAPDLFSAVTRGLDEHERQRILDRYYHPYRASVERVIASLIGSGHRVAHFSVHSCIDELNGQKRELELGLLFDPSRRFESETVDHISNWFATEAPEYRVRHNQPYLGTDDGLTSALRLVFPDPAYSGIELELRQGHIADENAAMALSEAIAASVSRLA